MLLANANELIEMQTRNDSTDPRSGSTFYERYHSLEDVSLSVEHSAFVDMAPSRGPILKFLSSTNWANYAGLNCIGMS